MPTKRKQNKWAHWHKRPFLNLKPPAKHRWEKYYFYNMEKHPWTNSFQHLSKQFNRNEQQKKKNERNIYLCAGAVVTAAPYCYRRIFAARTKDYLFHCAESFSLVPVKCSQFTQSSETHSVDVFCICVRCLRIFISINGWKLNLLKFIKFMCIIYQIYEWNNTAQ